VPTIDLSTVNESTRAIILSLLNSNSSTPITNATTPYTIPSPHSTYASPTNANSPTYASIAATSTNATTTSNTLNATPHDITFPDDYTPTHYDSDYDDTYNTTNDDDDEDINPFILVQHNTKHKNNSKQQPTPTKSSTKDGISGVKAASTLLWNDKAAAIIMNNDDIHRQTMRIVEGRKPNVESVTRPVIWIKFWFPTEIPDTTIAPNILQQELAIDYIISNLHVDFIIDRVYIGTLLNPIQIANDSLSFLGYAALSPRTSNTESNSIDKTTLQQLYTLEDRLHLITANTSNYQHHNATTPLLNHILFKLPHVNNYTEETTFLIEGLHQGIPNNDVATLRELATDIFRAIHSRYNSLNPNTKPSAVLQRHKSRFAINQILSVRSWNIPKSKQQKPTHSPQRKPNNSVDRALILVLNPHSSAASDLERIITSLSTTNKTTLPICGGNITINLIHFANVPKSDSKGHDQFFQAIRHSNIQHYGRTNVRLIRNINVHPRTISAPDHIPTLVRNITNCRAIIPNLEHGRRHPSLTCLFNFSTEQTTSDPEAIFQLIANTAYSTLNIDITPPNQPKQTTSTNTTASTTTHTINNFVGYNIPKTVNSTSTAPRYYVLINVAGGLFMTGIYKGHFDDNNLRPLTDKVSHNIFRKFLTEAEAWTYFLSYYPDYNTYEKILFLNYNCPIESSNMNNPCPRVQDQIRNSTNTNPIKERTFFRPDLMAPHITLARLAATERMTTQKQTPNDSYDFLPPNHPRTYHSPTDLPINQALIPPNTHPSSSNPNFALEQCILELEQESDDVSVMTEQTKTLNVNPSVQQHETIITNTTTSKRARKSSDRSISTVSHHETSQPPTSPTHTYISIRTPINMTPTEILHHILTHNTNDIIPKMAIGLDITFAPTITNHSWKLAYLRINETDSITNILTILKTHFQDSHPQLITSTSAIPRLLTSTPTLDTSPPTHTHLNIPTNCRIEQCPLYNTGIEELIADDDLHNFCTTMEKHGLGIHSDLLNNTPLSILESIGWYRCCPNCESLHFGDTSINTHRESCPTFNEQTMVEINEKDESPTNELSQTSLFDSCPEQYHTKLHTLIDNGTSAANINAQILRWINASRVNSVDRQESNE
jgi:hypothetical protein